MILITIVLLIILINFLFSKKEVKNNTCTCKFKFLPGSLGSPPSDYINSYDSNTPIIIPTDPESLILEFINHGNSVFEDFKNNINSEHYKHYVFADYKLNFMKNNNMLTTDQITKYNTNRLSITKGIENIFNYYLDIIKYNSSKSYKILKRRIVNNIGTNLLVNMEDIDDITARVINVTNIPEIVLQILYNKSSAESKKLLEQVLSMSGDNYFKTMTVLYIVLLTPPSETFTILGRTNATTIEVENGVNVNKLGIWTRLYDNLHSDKITSILIDIIRVSLMTEKVYYAIIKTFIKLTRDPVIEKTIMQIVQHCHNSLYNIISMFKYQFTYILILDAIAENEAIIQRYGIINVQNLKYPENELSARYSLMPDYMRSDKFNNLYENYTSPVSELTMYNNYWEKNKIETTY
jgi:hypothetical protein